MPIDTKEKDYISFIFLKHVILYDHFPSLEFIFESTTSLIFLHSVWTISLFLIFLCSAILFYISLFYLEGLQLILQFSDNICQPKEYRYLNFLYFFPKDLVYLTSDKHNEQWCCYVTAHTFFIPENYNRSFSIHSMKTCIQLICISNYESRKKVSLTHTVGSLAQQSKYLLSKTMFCKSKQTE